MSAKLYGDKSLVTSIMPRDQTSILQNGVIGKLSFDMLIARMMDITQYNFAQGSTPTGIATSVAPSGGACGFTNNGSLTIFGHKAFYADLGTTSSGIAYWVGANITDYQFGLRPMLYLTGIYIEDLATVAEDYECNFGWFDVFASGDAVDGIYLKYKRATSTKFIRCTAANSVRTANAATDAAATVAEDALTHLGIYVNAAATQADYYVNGTLIGSETTNIPGISRATGIIGKFEKTAGTTSRKFHVKYAGVCLC